MGTILQEYLEGGSTGSITLSMGDGTGLKKTNGTLILLSLVSLCLGVREIGDMRKEDIKEGSKVLKGRAEGD